MRLDSVSLPTSIRARTNSPVPHPLTNLDQLVAVKVIELKNNKDELHASFLRD